MVGDEVPHELAGLHDRVEAFDALPLARGAAVELDPRPQRPGVADAETQDVVVLAVVDVEGPELPLPFGPRGAPPFCAPAPRAASCCRRSAGAPPARRGSRSWRRCFQGARRWPPMEPSALQPQAPALPPREAW